MLRTGFGYRIIEAQYQGLAATFFCSTYSVDEQRILFLCFISQLPMTPDMSHNSVSKKNISILMLRPCLH